MSELHDLLAVQELDSAIDQIPHRIRRLPERALAEETAAARSALEQRTAAAADRAAAATARIDELEEAGTARARKKARLEQQLRTVSSSREADALMHEIATLDGEGSDADDEELGLLDVVEHAEADMADAEVQLVSTRAVAAQAAEELDAAEAVLAAELDVLSSQRAEAAATIPADLLRRYESMRSSMGGVAISRVTGGRCGACHLDLSRAFLDALRAAPPGELVECEQCARLLVP